MFILMACKNITGMSLAPPLVMVMSCPRLRGRQTFDVSLNVLCFFSTFCRSLIRDKKRAHPLLRIQRHKCATLCTSGVSSDRRSWNLIAEHAKVCTAKINTPEHNMDDLEGEVFLHNSGRFTLYFSPGSLLQSYRRLELPRLMLFCCH